MLVMRKQDDIYRRQVFNVDGWLDVFTKVPVGAGNSPGSSKVGSVRKVQPPYSSKAVGPPTWVNAVSLMCLCSRTEPAVDRGGRRRSPRVLIQHCGFDLPAVLTGKYLAVDGA
jgi:hypothetical protein